MAGVTFLRRCRPFTGNRNTERTKPFKVYRLSSCEKNRQNFYPIGEKALHIPKRKGRPSFNFLCDVLVPYVSRLSLRHIPF
jgi:hypothetical protein